ncbi:ammonium transporter (TC 1.A.11) [Hymenobacter daecheongensis DSM 21074]|uniref:Ammonium transporter n=1 Tax=Hymenobacter daecheongensis DSM 21074 TaxID=1121955 RepID=A0A1M6GQV9_9BACT|nr:ammonium transporter [Hymenobacter daecheongensis]SHJ12266.1 ammonium transporter (TC 1.A.11) [Hymenobacter daecheongensis DSM 21074]
MSTTETLPARRFGYSAFLLLGLVGLSLAAAFIEMPHPAAAPGSLNAADVAWMLTATAFVLIMTPGLSFFYGGMVRPKNVISTMLQSFVALGVITLVWYFVGFSLAYGTSWRGLIGNPLTFGLLRNVGTAPHPVLSPGIPFILFFAFQLKFAVITPALITGSFAERVRFKGYLAFMVLFCLFIYCPLAHWTWHPDGFLRRWGVLDFAGGTVVHISAGIAALAGALVLGPRVGGASRQPFATPNVPYVLLGTGLLWFGWFGFNAGSALGANALAAQAFVTTNLASAAALIAWMLVELARGGKPTAVGACIGAVVGLVAITPAAGYVSYGQSILIGVVAALISQAAVHWQTSYTNIDDTLDVFPCHGLGGIVGMLLTGVFAESGGLIHGTATLFGYHVLGLLIVVVYSFLGSWALLKITDSCFGLRVKATDEERGLDLSQHAESTYHTDEEFEHSYRKEPTPAQG